MNEAWCWFFFTSPNLFGLCVGFLGWKSVGCVHNSSFIVTTMAATAFRWQNRAFSSGNNHIKSDCLAFQSANISESYYGLNERIVKLRLLSFGGTESKNLSHGQLFTLPFNFSVLFLIVFSFISFFWNVPRSSSFIRCDCVLPHIIQCTNICSNAVWPLELTRMHTPLLDR